MNNDWMWQKTKLDPAYSGMDRGYNSRTGALAPAPLNAPVTAASRTASRVIPPPSGTNWNSTFLNNNPASPSGTDWKKTFGGGNSFTNPQPASAVPNSAIRDPQSAFSFSLSPATDRSALSLSSPQSAIPPSDFQDRASNLDITSRDHELYGAGKDLGFTY